MPTQRQIAAHVPEARMPARAPDTPDLALCVQIPDLGGAVGDGVAHDFADGLAHAGVAGGADDDVGVEGAAVGEHGAGGGEVRDAAGAVEEVDAPVDDEARAAYVDVVAAAVGDVFAEDAAVGGGEGELEAAGLERVEQGFLFPRAVFGRFEHVLGELDWERFRLFVHVCFFDEFGEWREGGVVGSSVHVGEAEFGGDHEGG